jgi:hypothetical protein
VTHVDGRLGVVATIVLCVLVGAIGVFVGVVTTFTHRQLPPVGLAAGIAIVGCLLAGARLVFGSRIVAGAAAAGLLGAVAVLSLPGAGGSVVVSDDAAGWTWAIATPLIAAVVLAWPRMRPAPARAVAAAPAAAAAPPPVDPRASE